jgi:hypothetical protein
MFVSARTSNTSSLSVSTMARKIGVRAQFGVTLLAQTGIFEPNWDPTPNLLQPADHGTLARLLGVWLGQDMELNCLSQGQEWCAEVV